MQAVSIHDLHQEWSEDLVHMSTSDFALKKIENKICEFQKNYKKYLHVANYLFNMGTSDQRQQPCHPGGTVGGGAGAGGTTAASA
jgi:hypothetical protein